MFVCEAKEAQAPVKVTPIGINRPNGPQCVMGKSDEGCPVDDGFAHWQAPKQPTVTCEGCGSGDILPMTINKESCTTIYKGKWSDDTNTCYLVDQLGAVGAIMEQIAPEKPDPIKTAQDGYDCTMSRTPKTITIICTLKEPK